MLTGCGREPAPDTDFATVPRVEQCAPGARPEEGLQGQVPAAVRAAGFGGYQCNLEVVGQARGEGAGFSFAAFTDKAGHTCTYNVTAYPFDDKGNPAPGRRTKGVQVVDFTDPARPVLTASLTSAAMMDPWESLRINPERQILIAAAGATGGFGAEVDIYDLSTDCRHPVLLFSGPLGTGKDGGLRLGTSPLGHEGNFAPDGKTLYLGDSKQKKYYAVDIADPGRPRMIGEFDPQKTGLGGGAHGLSISEDGNRAYFVSNGRVKPENVGKPDAPVDNGFFVVDVSDFQARKPDPQFRIISETPVRDGSVAQHTLPVSIAGKPYLVFVDEGGSGPFKQACAAGLSPFSMARIYDLSDEKTPRLVSKLRLEVNSAKNCDKVAPDIANLMMPYGSHYCSADNRLNATILACSHFNGGLRVFDIRKPESPREIAYFNPAGTRDLSRASAHAYGVAPYWKSQWHPGAPDWCTASSFFDFDKGLLITSCQDNGVIVLRFAKGTWPLPESTPGKGLYN